MTTSRNKSGASVGSSAGASGAIERVPLSSLDLPRHVDGYLASSTTYGALEAGDRCVVIDGFWVDKLKGCRLEFVRVDVNVRTGRHWLVLWGGKGANLGWQYMSPENLKRV